MTVCCSLFKKKLFLDNLLPELVKVQEMNLIRPYSTSATPTMAIESSIVGVLNPEWDKNQK